MLIQTAAGGDALTELALSARLDLMRAEIAGERATPLEALLSERVVACWMLVELFEALVAAQLWKDYPSKKRVTPAALKHYLYWQEIANKRFFCAIRELARIRRLQSGIPNVQTNVQINLGGAKPKDLSA